MSGKSGFDRVCLGDRKSRFDEVCLEDKVDDSLSGKSGFDGVCLGDRDRMNRYVWEIRIRWSLSGR